MADSSKQLYWWKSLRNLCLIIAAWGIPALPALAQNNSAPADDPSSALAEPFNNPDNDLEMLNEKGTSNINVTPFMTVDLHVQDTDLADVLKMLSMQSDKNIILSNNVAATVTADLYDVTFYEALDAILNANGYGYIEKGKFINIYTREELEAIKSAERTTVYRRYELSYMSAKDASAFVTPLLSEEGTITINGDVAAGIDPDVGDVGDESWAYSATIVVMDYAENVEIIGALLTELDTRPQQVLVEATVLQTKLTEDNAWGIDWNFVADMDFANLTNPLSAAGDLLDGTFKPADGKAFGGGTNVGRVGGPGTFKLGIISNDISVFIRLLDEISDTTVMSRPKVLALNRQRGEILIGAQIGYLSTTATQTSTTQTVEFLDTGTKLIFRPFIARDGFIRMELAPSVSEGLIREVTSSGGDAVTIPDRITQELTTNVLVRDGHTVVLGGLFREDTTLTRSQVPILGSIPLIGPAFQGKSDTTERQEITFLITPTIMKDEYLDAMGNEAIDGVRRARIAARMGTLIWSNERLTAQSNMRAEEYMQNGNNEMALWEIEKSLSLRPNQPEVLRLKEQITGTRDRWFDSEKSKTTMKRAIAEHLQTALVAEPIENTSKTVREINDTAGFDANASTNPIAFDLETFSEEIPDTAANSDAASKTESLTTDEPFTSDASTSVVEITIDAEMEFTEKITDEFDPRDYIDYRFGFDLDPAYTIAGLEGRADWFKTLESDSPGNAVPEQPLVTIDQPFSIPAAWLKFQQTSGIDSADEIEFAELAEVSTEQPGDIK